MKQDIPTIGQRIDNIVDAAKKVLEPKEDPRIAYYEAKKAREKEDEELDIFVNASSAYLSPTILELIRQNPRETQVFDQQRRYLYSRPFYLG